MRSTLTTSVRSQMRNALKLLPAESGQCPHPTLDALLPAILDRAFKGEL